MRRLRLLQVDVFTRVPLAGNAVAVVPDAGALGADDMQAIARETNLSETTFVTAATAGGADDRVRIFTPGHELGVGGLPTIGTVASVIVSGELVRGRRATGVRERRAGGLGCV